MKLKPFALISFSVLLAMILIVGVQINASRGTLQVGDAAPKINGSEWINSPPLTTSDLSGHVVLIEFWTYG